MEKYEKYGVLVTVASLLLVVVYASDPYDGWDLMVSFLAGYFGISFLRSGMSFDWFSSFNASFISVVSVTIALLAATNIWNVSDQFINVAQNKPFGISNHLLVAIVASIALSLWFKPKKV